MLGSNWGTNGKTNDIYHGLRPRALEFLLLFSEERDGAGRGYQHQVFSGESWILNSLRRTGQFTETNRIESNKQSSVVTHVTLQGLPGLDQSYPPKLVRLQLASLAVVRGATCMMVCDVQIMSGQEHWDIWWCDGV